MIFALWFLWGLYWAVAVLGRAPAQRRQPPLERLAHMALVGAGFILYYSADPRWGALNRQSGLFLPRLTGHAS